MERGRVETVLGREKDRLSKDDVKREAEVSAGGRARSCLYQYWKAFVWTVHGSGTVFPLAVYVSKFLSFLLCSFYLFMQGKDMESN